MAKNQNTYEKLRREMDKKRKAQEKRAGKLRRKETPTLPEAAADAASPDALASPAARSSTSGQPQSMPLPAGGVPVNATGTKFAAWRLNRSAPDTVPPA